jgi:hypothetical protein
MALGINLTLLIGENVPRPAPRSLIEALKSLEVTQSDEGRSGFQIVFQLGRSNRNDIRDYQLLKEPLLKVFNRIILTITMGATAQIVMDGIITNQQFSPSTEPGNSTLAITGEDVSVMMDLEKKSVEHTAQDEATIAQMLISQYAKYGMVAQIVAPKFKDRPTKNERIPSQQGTDLEYLKAIGTRFSNVFYIIPGPASGTNTAYWGPPQRKTQPQPPLTVNMGSFTNVTSINFQNNAMSATEVKGKVQDRRTNKIQTIAQNTSTRPALAAQAALTQQAQRRTERYRETGRDTTQATERAKAITDHSVDNVVTVTGDLDAVTYGTLLQVRGVVTLRGVGFNYDGLYYVKSVTHKINKGDYKQSFTITREGLGSTI